VGTAAAAHRHLQQRREGITVDTDAGTICYALLGQASADCSVRRLAHRGIPDTTRQLEPRLEGSGPIRIAFREGQKAAVADPECSTTHPGRIEHQLLRTVAPQGRTLNPPEVTGRDTRKLIATTTGVSPNKRRSKK